MFIRFHAEDENDGACFLTNTSPITAILYFKLEGETIVDIMVTTTTT